MLGRFGPHALRQPAYERNLSTMLLGVTPATAFVVNCFRAPPSGATIQRAFFGPGSPQGHSTTEADTWVCSLKLARSGLRLNSQQASLSGVTVAATGYKQLVLDAGRCTLLSGDVLTMSCGISGSPAALSRPTVVVEWAPKNNV